MFEEIVSSVVNKRAFFFIFWIYRSKTYVFEEFLLTWQDRLRKLKQPTSMSVKLQGEVDKYKVFRTFQVITLLFTLFYFAIFVINLKYG